MPLLRFAFALSSPLLRPRRSGPTNGGGDFLFRARLRRAASPRHSGWRATTRARSSEALRRAPEAQREAMAFLRRVSPAGGPRFHDLSRPRRERRSRGEGARGHAVGEGGPRGRVAAFVLRIGARSGSRSEKWRAPFFAEVLPRVRGLKSLRQAALEVNRWAAENVTFQQTTSRDQAPLTTRRRDRAVRRRDDFRDRGDAVGRHPGAPGVGRRTGRLWTTITRGSRSTRDAGWHYLGGASPRPTSTRPGSPTRRNAPGWSRRWRTGCSKARTSIASGGIHPSQHHRVYGKTGRVRVHAEKGVGSVRGRQRVHPCLQLRRLRPLARRVAGRTVIARRWSSGLALRRCRPGKGTRPTAAAHQRSSPGAVTEATLDAKGGRGFEASLLRYPAKRGRRRLRAARRSRTGSAGRASRRGTGGGARLKRQRRRWRAAADRSWRALVRQVGSFAASADPSARGCGRELKGAGRGIASLAMKGGGDLLSLLEDVPTKTAVEFSTHPRPSTGRSPGAQIRADDAIYRAGVLAARIGTNPPWRGAAKTLA